MRQQAASEIERALKTGGIFKVIFMVTLEAGRVKPDDKTTIQLVLNAAPQIESNYSILINKLPKTTVEKLKNNENDRKALVVALNEGLPGTFFIYYNVRHADLEDEENKVVALDPELIAFIESAPTITLTTENVTAIQFDKFEQVKQMLSAQLEALKRDNELMKRKIEEQEDRYRRQMVEQKEVFMREMEVQEKRFQNEKMELWRERNSLMQHFRDTQERQEQEQSNLIENTSVMLEVMQIEQKETQNKLNQQISKQQNELSEMQQHLVEQEKVTHALQNELQEKSNQEQEMQKRHNREKQRLQERIDNQSSCLVQ
eukprot:Phypoly_transcript_07411.p1 GENE.Phypoly_transcript_07411~~Phypoly_transcript_07411.p1  ORF type:complete len:316 (+),score=76.97 Phypoly_transcript_07411:656-1603(+)